jgi:hypothetical protein
MRRRHAAAGKLRGNKKVSTRADGDVTVTVTVSHGALQLFQFAILELP